MRSSSPSRFELAWLLALGGCVGDAPAVVECLLGTEYCGDRCVSLSFDPAHCGDCGSACPSGQACVDGACACLGEVCGDSCVDLASHPGHCGACDAACPEGRFCLDGRCETVCADPLTSCGARCVDTRTDEAHCGACDAPCAAGASCIGGSCACVEGLEACGARCADTTRDAEHCGECDNACALGHTCLSSSCALACGADVCAPSETVWSRRIGADSEIVTLAAAAFDAAGNVFVAGTFAGTLSLGDGLRIDGHSGGRDLFVAKLDAVGRPLWAKGYGSDGTTQEIYDAALVDGELVVAGATEGALDLGGIMLSGADRDALLARFDADGGVVSAERFGGAGVQRARSVAATPSGGIAVGGSFTQQLARDGTVFGQSGGAADTDGFVMLLDALGGTELARTMTDAAQTEQIVHAVSVSNDGYIAAVGTTVGAADWDTATIAAGAGGTEAVTSVFDALGVLVSAARWSGANADSADDVVALAGGELVVAGVINGAVTIEPAAGPACTNAALGAAGNDALLARVGADGCPVWAQAIGGPGADRAHAVAADGEAIQLLGRFNGNLVVDGRVALTAQLVDDGFVLALSPAGALTWARRLGGSVFGAGRMALAADPERVAAALSFHGSMAFQGAVASAASDDGFAVVLAR